MKLKTKIYIAILSLSALSNLAQAHVGVVNTQLPYAVAGKSYELVLTIPHGCTDPQDSNKHLDTYKVHLVTPSAFTSPRPIIDGVFGKPKQTTNSDGSKTTLVWTKDASLNATEDNQSYRVGVRGSIAATAALTKLTFNIKQFCKNPNGGADIIVNWAQYVAADGSVSNQSPTVKVFPATRQLGWNKFNLSSTNEKHTRADVKTFMSDFFSDAAIVWVGKGAYSANNDTTTKIQNLISTDSSYFELINKSDIMLHSTDDIWVKY